jgi:hypothetical protein
MTALRIAPEQSCEHFGHACASAADDADRQKWSFRNVHQSYRVTELRIS